VATAVALAEVFRGRAESESAGEPPARR
jgi:hypothetical protein